MQDHVAQSGIYLGVSFLNALPTLVSAYR